MNDNYKIIKDNNKNLEKKIFLELNSNNLIDFLSKKSNSHIIIKFGATWCVPCKRIENTLDELFIQMPDNVLCYELDVDNNMELFGKLKTKKMIKTIPSILYYNCNVNRDQWYLSDLSISDSNPQNVIKFFREIYCNFN